jgi:glycosyltransferase involved in cell wall biosynthesis
MKILQIIDDLGMGGAQKLIVTFTSEAKKRGVEVTVLALTQNRFEYSIQKEMENYGACVMVLSEKKILTISCLQKVIELIRQGDFSIIHSHLTYANIISGLAAAITGKPWIATLHSVASDARTTRSSTVQLERWTLRHLAMHIIAVGQSVAESYEPILHRKLDIILNGVQSSVEQTPAERIAMRAELTGDPDSLICIAVGRFTEAKGYDDLIEAFALVCEENPITTLVIAGDGKLRPDIEAHIAELGLGSKIVLLGNRHDIPTLLTAADIYLSASHWEGLPISHLEAMMLGLPVVVTSVGEIPRVVVPGTGLLVPPHKPSQLASAIISLLADPARRETMGRSAHRHVDENYSAASWFDKLLNLYNLAGSK